MFIWILLLLMPAVQASPYEYDYATACIPSSRSTTSPERNQCSLLILSRSNVTIQIHTSFNRSSFTLAAGQLYRREFDVAFHPSSGAENKAIRISSTDEIQVLMYKGDTDNIQFHDVVMVPNQMRNNESDTYFTSAYNGANDECTLGSNRNQFYLVSSFYADTFISVRHQDGTIYELTLPEFGTFVQITNDLGNHLASGTKITSSKPINVVSGNLCVLNRAGGAGYSDSYVSDVPRVESLGTEYVVPKIISDDVESPAGFSITVVATENNTLVVSDGEMRWIDEGETAVHEYPNQTNSTYVNCRKPCLVSQYAKSDYPVYGMFMQNILSEAQFYSSAFFTTLNPGPTSYLSVVVKGETSGWEVYLNGTSLGFLTWTPINGYSSAELPLPGGEYELLSQNGRPFAAYVYEQRMVYSGASGYALLPMDTSGRTTTPPTDPSTTATTDPSTTLTTDPSTTEPITTEPITTEPITTDQITTDPITTDPITTYPITSDPITTDPITTDPITTDSITTDPSTTTPPTTPAPSTTPRPSSNGTLPRHTVRVNGTAVTSDGQDITPQCAMAHANNLNQKNARMLIEVNEAIGKSICVDSGDLLDVSSQEGISVQGNKALIRIDHILKVDWHHVAVEVETCALEVADYLNYLSHWPQPIFPSVPDCSGLELVPAYFNTSGTFWNCDSQQDEDTFASNVLSYEIKVSEILGTKDGSILDIACTNAYTNEAGKKTTSMSGEISVALSGSGCDDIVSPATHTTSLIGLGEQAYFVATFFYLPSPVASFSEFVACMAEVHAFTVQHENWSPGSQPGDPFLPVPPGCPALEHDTDTLDSEGNTWRCV